jgi:hypothetical protein
MLDTKIVKYSDTYTDQDGNTYNVTVIRHPSPAQPKIPTANNKKGKKSSRNTVTFKDYIQG